MIEFLTLGGVVSAAVGLVLLLISARIADGLEARLLPPKGPPAKWR